MDTVTLSSKYQGVIFLVPERSIRAFRGVAEGPTGRGLREKKDRL